MANLDIKSANFTYKSIRLHGDVVFIDDKIVCDDDIESIDFASEESIKKVKGSLGWGVAGAVTFGVVGAAAGLLLGGKKKETTFIFSIKSGKTFIAATDPNSFKALQDKFNKHREYVNAMGKHYLSMKSLGKIDYYE